MSRRLSPKERHYQCGYKDGASGVKKLTSHPRIIRSTYVTDYFLGYDDGYREYSIRRKMRIKPFGT